MPAAFGAERIVSSLVYNIPPNDGVRAFLDKGLGLMATAFHSSFVDGNHSAFISCKTLSNHQFNL